MKSEDIFNVLNSETRRNLLKLLAGNAELALKELVERFSITSNKPLSRETIYRHLEILTKAKMVNKTYDSTKKRLKYSCSFQNVSIDLETFEISFISKNKYQDR